MNLPYVKGVLQTKTIRGFFGPWPPDYAFLIIAGDTHSVYIAIAVKISLEPSHYLKIKYKPSVIDNVYTERSIFVKMNLLTFCFVFNL